MNVSKMKTGILFGALFVFLLFLPAAKVNAKTVTITTPEQLRDLNKNYKSGSFKIGNDMTLGDSNEKGFCRLIKGNITIDFNGHTVQNSSPNNAVFKICGAKVVFKDSKYSKKKPSVRSYGAGGVEVLSGSLRIKNGYYYGRSDGTNNPVGVHVGGGKCVISGGYIRGDYVGLNTGGGKTTIKGGKFKAGYTFALCRMGGTVKIQKGTFISGTTTYGYQMALGSYDLQQKGYNFNKMLAKGSKFKPKFQTGYWNMQSSMTAQPSFSSVFAVTYNTHKLKVVKKK